MATLKQIVIFVLPDSRFCWVFFKYIVYYKEEYLCTNVHILVHPSRYTEKASSVEQEETVLNIQFVKVDCSPLKSSLVQHCSVWQTKLTQLLSQLASHRLKEIHTSIHDNSDRWGLLRELFLWCIFMCFLQTGEMRLNKVLKQQGAREATRSHE